MYSIPWSTPAAPIISKPFDVKYRNRIAHHLFSIKHQQKTPRLIAKFSFTSLLNLPSTEHEKKSRPHGAIGALAISAEILLVDFNLDRYTTIVVQRNKY
jgi:hypothetical protein